MATVAQLAVQTRVDDGTETDNRPPTPGPEHVSSADTLAANDVKLTVADNLSPIEAEWRRFESVADATVFQSYDWLATWQRCIGSPAGVEPAIVLGRDAQGALLFILPLAIEPGRLARRLTFLGRELCDYNAPLLAPDFSRRIGRDGFLTLWAAIRATLQRDARTRHGVVLLDKMPEQVGQQDNPLVQLRVAPHPSGAYLTALVGDWETFYSAKRSSSTRRRDRTKRKKLGESGDVVMVTPTDAADLDATLAILIAQKRRAFGRMGVADLFAKPGVQPFFEQLTAGARDLVHVSRLDVGTVPAATNLGLTFRGCYYHILASYDEGPLSRFGPGAVHLRELMRYAIEHGCTRFDFTIGDEPYKRDWCDTELRLHDHIAAAGARGWVVATAVTQMRRAKRAIKHSAQWPALMRLRAKLGRGAAKPAAEPSGDA